MKKKSDETALTRRRFFRQSACASLGITGVVNSLAHVHLMKSALANTAFESVGDNDYKALVVLFLFGGNDSNNMLIPGGGHPQRPNYEGSRGILTVPTSGDGALLPLNVRNGEDAYGVHPTMGKVRDLFNNDSLSFVANVGTLIEPTTKAAIATTPLPPQLFSHADQAVQWQSSVPDQPFTSGWGGRIADLINSTGGINSDDISTTISLNGINRFQVGRQTSQFTLSAGGVRGLSSLGATGRYADRRTAFDKIMEHSYEHIMEETYAGIVQKARESGDVVTQALNGITSPVDLDGIFASAGAHSDLGDQLKMIARLIAGRDGLGNKRQIFFCASGGWDTHQNQLVDQGPLLNELSNALAAFDESMIALGQHNRVLTITHSDFARTLTPNRQGANNAGSDHGWGGHQIVMGGPVRGRRIFGEFPDLVPGGDDDTVSDRGRWIPSTSVDQFSSVAARWMGVPDDCISEIFPNLSRFDDPLGSSVNLRYINV